VYNTNKISIKSYPVQNVEMEADIKRGAHGTMKEKRRKIKTEKERDKEKTKGRKNKRKICQKF
jgi:hypothetical protein